MAVAGSGPLDFCAQWEASSGVDAASALFSEHRLLFHTFWLLIGVDQVAPESSSAVEHVPRRVFQIQRAVAADAQRPAFDGLQEHMSHLDDVVLGGAFSWMGIRTAAESSGGPPRLEPPTPVPTSLSSPRPTRPPPPRTQSTVLEAGRSARPKRSRQGQTGTEVEENETAPQRRGMNDKNEKEDA